MRYGVVFPQLEIGVDPGDIKAFAQAVERLGYSDILAYDHVFGIDVQRHSDWDGPYTSEHMFHEPFVLYGYLASVTERLRLVTGIIILPQRKTPLVAKQAAEVDILSKGRLNLGVGVGWNNAEYDAMGENFHDRGRRIEEQVEVLRLLWTQDIVDFDGQWHSIHGVGLNPLPIQRPIPIWFGGDSDPVLKRVGRMGDGWLIEDTSIDKGKIGIERLRIHASNAGRDLSQIEIGAVVELSQGDLYYQLETVREWANLGVTRIYIVTMGIGLDTVYKHIDAISNFKIEVDNIDV